MKENIIAKILNKKYILPVYSGTLAIEGVLRILKEEKKKKVLINSYNCHSILQAIINSGLEPVIAIPGDGITLTKEEIKNAVKKEKIDIYIAVHQYGYEQPIPSIKDLTVIEDISQSWNIVLTNRRMGKDVDYVITSLGKTKLISNGIGGLILSDLDFTNKFDLKVKENRLINHNLIEYYYPEKINYKKLVKKANKKVKKNRKTARLLNNIFKEYSFIKLMNTYTDIPTYHRYVIEVDKDLRNKFIYILDKSKIKYQKEFKIKLDELPVTKKNKYKVIGKNSETQKFLIYPTNKKKHIKKLKKEMKKNF